MSKPLTDQTVEFQQYIDGQEYNTRINLYENNNKAERFYSGDQWAGVQANGLPTPVFNIFKRIINYFIATIMSQNVSMKFVPENVGDEPQNEEEFQIAEAAKTISEYSDTLFEKNKMIFKLRQWLLDAALSGDAAAYNYWDATIDTLQAVLGDICIESIDSVNVMFGNPNDVRVQSQPYILIIFRQLVADLKEEAKLYGVPQDKIDMISYDTDTEYQSGDRAKIELENKDSSVGKTTAILKLWKVGKKIMAKKSTRYTDIRPEWDTKLTRYPVAWMNWDPRKNSYHGQAIGTGLVPNQIFINKAFAMAMMSMMHTAFPKLLYNKTFITAVNNQIGGAIGVEADGSMNISNMATYMQTGNMSEQVFKLIDLAIQYTKDMLGATDAALGDIKPDNTSAIIAVQQASGIPLETVKQNLYQFVEDIGYNMLDMMAANYGKRKIDVMVMGKRVIKEFDFSILKRMKFRIKIEVGPSSYWSQISAMQTLDALLERDRITFLQYLDRVEGGLIPKTQELIEEVKAQDMKQKFIYEQMARFIESLPPEMQMELQAMKPEEMEAKVMEMMMQPPEVQQQGQQQAQAQQEQMMMQEQQSQQMAQQQEQMKSQQQFEQTAALKQMDIIGKLELEDRKREKVGSSK